MSSRVARYAVLGGIAVALLAASPAWAYKRETRVQTAPVVSPVNAATDPAQQSGKVIGKEDPSLNEHLVDRRYRISKNHQHELGIYGGDYLGDEWLNNWDVGARYYFHVSDVISLGAEYMYNPIRADSDTDFGQGLTTKHSHSLFAAIGLSNDVAMRATKHYIIDCDLFLTLGIGSIQINHLWKILGVVGGGIKLYTGIPWFTVRFDINGMIHPTPQPGYDSTNADLVMNLGFSFLFPHRVPEALPVKQAVEAN